MRSRKLAANISLLTGLITIKAIDLPGLYKPEFISLYNLIRLFS